MIDGNNDYVTKSKLTITLKPLNKYNERSKIDILKTVAQNRLTVNIQRERELRILTWKNHPLIKFQRLRKIRIRTFGSLVHQINSF